jgi:peptidoglycan/LPS O-acetylase OafA/YrhL
MNSLEDILQKYQRIGPGFDFLRIFLATTIVAIHAVALTGHLDEFNKFPMAWFFEYALVPMFFALSGFLITASAIRLSLKNFLLNRGLRIVPALAVDIMICALIIGPIFTTVSYGEYFTDPLFFRYFLNIIGYIHFDLPGVFLGTPLPLVNVALWTVPYEILCYVFAAFFIVMKWLPGKYKVLFLTLALAVCSAVLDIPAVMAVFPERLQPLLTSVFLHRPSRIMSAFLFGMIAYQWRHQIKYSRVWLFASVATCVAAALVPATEHIVALQIVLIPALTYITVYLGLTKVPVPEYFKKGDYSYGVYLYHAPLIQVIITLFPGLTHSGAEGVILTFIGTMALALLVANLSWHFIEKPILGLRRKFSFVARVRELTPETPAAEAAAPQPAPVEPVRAELPRSSVQ